jgi:translocon-associated protein subunit alpha
MRLLALFLFGLIAFACIGRAVAQDEGEAAATTESTNTTATNVTVPVLEPSPDVQTVVFFPSSAEKRFPTGKPVQVLIGFTNNGIKSFNVSIVTASLMYPQDWRYYIQNYTKQAEFVIVPPSSQATFAYTFTPDAFLEPREFGLMGNIYYSLEDGSANYTSVFYNSTITLIEPNEPVDLQTFFMYVGIVGIAGLVGFVLFQSLTGLSGKKNKRPKVEVGTQRSNVLDSDWLEGTSAARSPAQKRPKRS